MSDDEWSRCSDPTPMLDFLTDKAGRRKFRLFSVACARRIPHLLFDRRTFSRLDVAERYADGLASDEEDADSELAYADALRELQLANDPATENRRLAVACVEAGAIPRGTTRSDLASVCAEEVAGALASVVSPTRDGEWESAYRRELAAQSDLVRDLFGERLRPVIVDPRWLLGNGGEVAKLARAIYDRNQWGEMPRLGEALSRAGCRDDEILAHCARRGGHARGCWVVDGLLGMGDGVGAGLVSESDWSTCADPAPMSEILCPAATDRKWRLFSVACCRRVWELTQDARSREAIEAAELFADGRVDDGALARAWAAADDALRAASVAEDRAEAESGFCLSSGYCRVHAVLLAAIAAWQSASTHPRERGVEGNGHPWELARLATEAEARSAALRPFTGDKLIDIFAVIEGPERVANEAESRKQCEFIRDIFGRMLGAPTQDVLWLPFSDGVSRWSLRPGPTHASLSQSCLSSADGLVVRLASEIYEGRSFDRMCVLADALEAAGCTDTVILGHCRSADPHVRGCWVLDLLLGKE